MLPDGITYTKGFVKDPKEAKRYLSLTDGASGPQIGKMEETDQQEVKEKPEDRTRVDLTKNVQSLFLEKVTPVNIQFLMLYLLNRSSA